MTKETKGIRAVLILEIIGKPSEHLVKTLEEIIEKINSEKGVVVEEKKIKKPVLMKDSKEFYTTFGEVEVDVETISQLTNLIFKYMPAHIEVIEPELIALTNNGWSEILTEITQKLHRYDEIARILEMQNSQMQQKLKGLEKK